MAWGKKKKLTKATPASAPVEDDELPDIAAPEVEEEEPVVKKEEEDELTEEIAKQVLTNHETRLKRIEYHLRL